MPSVSQTKIPADYSGYRNYNKKQSKNVIMNNLQIDSGYPQDVFVKNAPHKSHDYIQDNKKNLKNFFKDRLPENQITKDTFKTKTLVLDPMRIFQIKRQQFQLKNQTKMVLNGTFLNKKQRSFSVRSKDIEKIEEIFFVNDKTLEFKKKFGSLNIQRFDSYSKDNYRRGTRSFMQKRSRILKRQAYEKVFGPDISSVSRTLPMTPNLQLSAMQRITHKTSSKKRHLSIDQKTSAKKENLSQLVKKIEDFKNKIKPIKLNYQEEQLESFGTPNSQTLISDHQLKQRQAQNEKNKQKMLGLIQNITSMYKGQAIEDNRTKINSFEDLEKLDSKFYLELNQHKKTRMQKRMYELYKYSMPETNELVSSKITTQHHQPLIKPYHNRQIHRHPSDILTITDRTQYNESVSLEHIQLKKKLTIHEKLKYLGTHLVKAYLQANFYMVNLKHLYSAFWEEKQPFKIPGSYAFFKAIKLNDVQQLKSFLHLEQNLLYEVDSKGRTPLMYACRHNKENIVPYFLSLGCNIDKQCNRKKTALFYALQSENIDTVTILLQYGANPWSSDDCPYQRMLKQINKQPFDIAFSNAKKIYLGVRLQLGNKKRAEFWHMNKHRIGHHQKIEF